MLILKLVLLCSKKSFLLNLTFKVCWVFLWDTLKKKFLAEAAVAFYVFKGK